MSLEVNFEPTKRLFIEVLTKDINVHDCLLDLIDNSIDAYVRNELIDKRRIDINFGLNDFLITDNCGGINKSDVKDEIFKFGATKQISKTATIGFYGIGLKRSIFKLGEEIKFETDDGKDFCSLDINVQQWALKPGWTLGGETKKTTLKEGQKPFTKIHIIKLKEDVKQYLDTAFINNFKETLSIYYNRFLEKKIDIYIDGKKIQPFNLSINIQEGAKVANYNGEIDGVNVRIVCWVEPRTKSRTPRERGRIGWNVFMNERLVIHDDLSERTGWTGEDGFLPREHTIYNEFRGLVFLDTNSPYKLPIDTTKTGFNKESHIYKFVLYKMIELAKPIVKYLNEKYKKTAETQSAEIKISEESSTKLTRLSLNQVKINQIFRAPISKKLVSSLTKISYSKKKERVEKVKKYLNINSNSDVGSETFEYFWKLEELGDE